MNKFKNTQKITKKHVIKGVYQCSGVTLKSWLTPKSWSTLGENNAGRNLFCAFFSVLFFCFAFFFLSFFLLMTEKKQITCLHAETNDFDRRTACGAPVCWSKYTTNINLKSLAYSNNHGRDLKTLVINCPT